MVTIIGNDGQERLFIRQAPKVKARGETDVVIADITDELNREREANKWGYWKPIDGGKLWVDTPALDKRTVAILVQKKYKTARERHDFYKECMRAKNERGSFSKCFWGIIGKKK